MQYPAALGGEALHMLIQLAKAGSDGRAGE